MKEKGNANRINQPASRPAVEKPVARVLSTRLGRLREMKPRKMCAAIANQVVRDGIEKGLEKLSEAERNVFFAVDLNGEILNGGISQYFTNSSGRDYKQALAALRTIGAKAQERIVLNWLKNLPPHVHPDNRNEVGRYVFADPLLIAKLQGYDKEYFNSVETFYGAVLNYVDKNLESFKIEIEKT